MIESNCKYLSIEPNCKHPCFSIDKEVLCDLHKWPTWITVSVLCRSFGFARQSKIREIVNRLRDRQKLKLHMRRLVGDEGYGMGVCISTPASWRKAHAIAQDYWDTVYPDSQWAVGALDERGFRGLWPESWRKALAKAG